jgi:hypothetical protein
MVVSPAVLLWNANNTMGFDRIDWPRLNFATTINFSHASASLPPRKSRRQPASLRHSVPSYSKLID